MTSSSESPRLYAKIGAHRRPITALSPPLVLLMMLLGLECLLLLYVKARWTCLAGTEWPMYVSFLDFWSGGGLFPNGLAFELMKLNTLMAIYLWVMLRGIRAFARRWQLLAFVAAGILLYLIQVELMTMAEPPEPYLQLQRVIRP